MIIDLSLMIYTENRTTLLGFTCSKSTIETPRQGVKYVQKFTIKTPKRCHCLRNIQCPTAISTTGVLLSVL